MSSLFKSTVIKGTRITDFSQTTATVGVTIPFGYGRFVSGGNCIWAPLPPKEHVAKKRQGKGGVKQEVYTYTLPYAIAFGKGQIYGYWWIKRNGKVVWTQDPSAPVDDAAYAAKWAQKATMYMGTMDQLPDSTIESYEGTGQVSAYHRLGYIVLEDDDVTEGGGAVPTYEACVMASPPEAYLTSHVYTQYVDDSLSVAGAFIGASTRKIMIDWPQPAEELNVEPVLLFAGTRPVQWGFSQYPEELVVAPWFIEASTKSVQRIYTAPPEDLLKVEPSFIGASTKQILSSNTIPPESLSIQPSFIGASTS